MNTWLGTRILATVALAAAALWGGCSSSDESGETTTGAPTGTATGTATGGGTTTAAGTPTGLGGGGGSAGGGGSGAGPAGTVFVECHFEAPPSSEQQGGVYTCDHGTATLFFGSNPSGPIFEHTADQGWMGSGAARFYTHTSGTNTYRNLAFQDYSAPAQQNLRYLLRVEQGGAVEIGGKWNLAEGATWRTWMAPVRRAAPLDQVQPEIAYDNTVWMAHGDGAAEGMCLSEGYQCCQHPNSWWSNAVTNCVRHEEDVFDYEAYEEQWVAIEVERHRDGRYRIYIWTQDGAFDGAYYEVDSTYDEDLAAAPFGAYLEDPNATGKYFVVDELVVSDQLIGPPPGF